MPDVCTLLFALFLFSMTISLLGTFMVLSKMPIKKAIFLSSIYSSSTRLFGLLYTQVGHLLNGSR
jgi:hypothetical protein